MAKEQQESGPLEPEQVPNARRRNASGDFRISAVRCVELDNEQYCVQIKLSSERVGDRFDTHYYALVELPGRWQAVVPAPPLVQDARLLWHRELIELVNRARLYVTLRRHIA